MHVSSLFIYPVKSARGTLVDELKFDEFGPLYDRRFLIVNSKNEALTQRDCPILAKLHPKISFKGSHLNLELSFVRKLDFKEEKISISLMKLFWIKIWRGFSLGKVWGMIGERVSSFKEVIGDKVFFSFYLNVEKGGSGYKNYNVL